MNPLVNALNAPETLAELAPAELDCVLRQARTALLLGVLAARVQDQLVDLPQAAQWQLKAGSVLCDKIRLDVTREFTHLRRALANLDRPVVVLKGAAYVLANLPAAEGRIFGDIDLLVHRLDLADIEALLEAGGWSMAGTEPYDERYYRRWTHELPPMEHIERGSTIDVHHAVVQERHLAAFDRDSMIDQAIQIDEVFSILQPVDMVLHACVHLFNDGEFDKALRDLLDIVQLVRHFDRTEADFRAQLALRAYELNFTSQLYFAMRYAGKLLHLAHPPRYLDSIRPDGHQDWLYDALFLRALMPQHSTADDRFTGLARQLLYVRGHYLRMPLRHLIPHLIRKAIMPEPQAPDTLPILRDIQEPNR